MMSDQILWTPSEERKRNSNLWAFADGTKGAHGAAPDDYAALLDWSINHTEKFHSALWDYLDIIGEKGETHFVPGATLREARFFPEARLNYTENLLRDADDRLAIIAHRDDGTRRELTA